MQLLGVGRSIVVPAPSVVLGVAISLSVGVEVRHDVGPHHFDQVVDFRRSLQDWGP